jgi:hypothetical protein
LPGLHAGDGIRQDAGLWTNVSIAPKLLAGRWKTLYSLEYRSKEHFRETSLWCGMWNVDYVFNPCIQVGIGYEFFLNREPGGGYGPEHRYYPEAIFSYGAGAFSVNLRSRVMNTFTQWNDPHWVGRNRLKAACSIHGTPLKPFAGVEPFHEIDPVAQRFQKIRYTAGCSYVAGRQKWDIYYLREDYLSQRFVRNILAIDYNYAF